MARPGSEWALYRRSGGHERPIADRGPAACRRVSAGKAAREPDTSGPAAACPRLAAAGPASPPHGQARPGRPRLDVPGRTAVPGRRRGAGGLFLHGRCRWPVLVGPLRLVRERVAAGAGGRRHLLRRLLLCSLPGFGPVREYPLGGLIRGRGGAGRPGRPAGSHPFAPPLVPCAGPLDPRRPRLRVISASTISGIAHVSTRPMTRNTTSTRAFLLSSSFATGSLKMTMLVTRFIGLRLCWRLSSR